MIELTKEDIEATRILPDFGYSSKIATGLDRFIGRKCRRAQMWDDVTKEYVPCKSRKIWEVVGIQYGWTLILHDGRKTITQPVTTVTMGKELEHD